MPRNRYTATIRIRERRRVNRQIKELASLARDLQTPHEDFTELPVTNEAKERRSTRITNNRRHKAPRDPKHGVIQTQ